MLKPDFVNQKNFVIKDKLGRQSFAAQIQDEGGGGFPHPLSLTQGETVIALIALPPTNQVLC